MYGIDNLKNNIKINKLHLISILLFITTIYFLSNIIIKIDIITENNSLKKQLLKELYTYNIKDYSLVKNEREIDNIKKDILNNKSINLEWLNIKRNGMTYVINIEEKKEKNKIEKNSFCNVVATKEGTITKIITKRGTPLKEINEHVNKGDTLISGIVSYNEETKALVCAEGQVFAHTWYTLSVELPKSYDKITKLDEYTKHILIKYNNKTKKIGKSKYQNPIIENKHIIKLFNIEILLSKEYKTKITKEYYTEDEIEANLNTLIKSKLQPLLINSNKIIKQNVLKKNDFNSKIEVELFIIIEEEISYQNIELETDVSQ